MIDEMVQEDSINDLHLLVLSDYAKVPRDKFIITDTHFQLETKDLAILHARRWSRRLSPPQITLDHQI